NRLGVDAQGGPSTYGLRVGTALYRALAEGSGADGGRQHRAANCGDAAGWGDKSTLGEPVPALRLRHVDGAELSSHPVRAVRGRRNLSLQERRGGAGVVGRACRPLCDLQAGAASGEDEDRLLQGCEPAWQVSEPGVRLSRVLIPSKEDGVARNYPRTRLHARGKSESAEGHQPDDPALDSSPAQRQVPAGSGQGVQSVHSRLDQLLRPLLPNAVAFDPE